MTWKWAANERGKSEERMFMVQLKLIELQITQNLIISTKEGVGRFVSWLMSVCLDTLILINPNPLSRFLASNTDIYKGWGIITTYFDPIRIAAYFKVRYVENILVVWWLRENKSYNQLKWTDSWLWVFWPSLVQRQSKA